MGSTADGEREFRNALGIFATGVTVITARDAAGMPHGLTVNSFAAVSLQPRLILWSQSLHSPSTSIFDAVEHFTVNVLALDQLELSRHFARPAADKFAGLLASDGLGGAPRLSHVAATFECLARERYPGGDHMIRLGEVLRFTATTRAPLLFASGRYQRGRDIEARPNPDADLGAAWSGLF